MSNPYDPNGPTRYPGQQPPPYPQAPQYPQTTPVPPQYPPPPTPGGFGPGPGGPGYGAPGGYGPPGFGGPPPKKSSAPLIIGVVVLVLVLAGGAVGGFLLLSGDDDEPRSASSSTSESDDPTDEPSSEEPTSEEPTSEETVEEPSSPAAPVPPAGDDLTAITGFYTGSYVCSQGPTPLTLTIAPNSASTGLDAVFSFGGGNSVVPAGSFLMEGTLRNGVLRLRATDWIVQPDGYVSVDLRADVPDASAKRISGKMLDPACDTFTVTR